MSHDSNVFRALEVLSNSLAKMDGDTLQLGSDPHSKWAAAVDWLHKTICPRRKQLEPLLQSKLADAVAILADASISAATDVPWVGTTLSKCLAEYGFERFCKDPAEFLDAQIDQTRD